MSNSRIEQIIEEIEDYIDSCKGPLFGGGDKIVVDRERMEELLRELRMKTPEEIKRYQKILANKDAKMCIRDSTLSAVVAALVQADLLILLSDIDGLFTDDPNKNPDAKFIDYVDHVDQHFEKMGKGSASDVGTGGMSTKLKAAKLATLSLIHISI